MAQTSNYQASYEIDGKQIFVSEKSQNSLEIREDGIGYQLDIEEKDSQRFVSLVNQQSGKKEQLVLNKDTGDLYSSYTGKTINISDLSEDVIDKPSVQLFARGSRVSYKYKWLSWRTLRNLIGPSVTGAGIFAGIHQNMHAVNF